MVSILTLSKFREPDLWERRTNQVS